MDNSISDQMREVWFTMTEKQRIDFIETNIQITNTKGNVIPLKLAEFQKKWLLDGPLFEDFTKKTVFRNRILLKIRNVGISMLIGVEATLTCWLYKNINIAMFSATESQAIDLIKQCKKIVTFAKFNIELKGGIEGQTNSRMVFSNSSDIRSFSSSAAGARGSRSLCVYLDEFAYNPYPEEVMDAAAFFLTEGGQLNVCSTPNGKQNKFYEIYSDRINYPSWNRHYVTLFKNMDNFDVNMPIPDQMSKYNLELTCPWLNIDFIEKRRQDDAINSFRSFLQELCGVATDTTTALISIEMLNRYSVESYHVDSAEEKKMYVISIDFGSDRNLTGITVFDCSDGKFVVCNTVTMKGDFLEQARSIQEIVEKFNPEFVIGDETGMGGNSWISMLSSKLKTGTVIGVNYSKKDYGEQYGVNMNNKEFFITTALKLMYEGKMIVPKNHRRLREELLGMQKIIYERNIKYSGKDGPAKGDDLAMSFFQASLLYNMIYEMDGNEGIGFVDNNIKMNRVQIKRDDPVVKQVDFVEASGAVKRKIERITGFDKLI